MYSGYLVALLQAAISTYILPDAMHNPASAEYGIVFNNKTAATPRFFNLMEDPLIGSV
jgi:hypothetical protein